MQFCDRHNLYGYTQFKQMQTTLIELRNLQGSDYGRKEKGTIQHSIAMMLCNMASHLKSEHIFLTINFWSFAT